MSPDMRKRLEDDPEFQPAAGLPIIKVIWDEASKRALAVFDPAQFPNLEFVGVALKMLVNQIDADIKRQGDFQFQQNTLKAMHDAQLKAGIMADKTAENAQAINNRLKNMRG
jgi:hypothetical protein